MQKTGIPNPVKSHISSAAAGVAPDLLKALAILSDTTFRRSAVDLEDLKPFWELEKRPHFSRWSTIQLFSSFSKDLTWLFLFVIYKTNFTLRIHFMVM